MPDWEARLIEAGVELRAPLPAGGVYSPVVVDGSIAYTSGVVAVEESPLRLAYRGRLGDDLSLEDGQRSAAGAMVSTLSNLRATLGGLDRVERFLKVTGFVRVAPDFTDMPKVMDGASDLLVKVFGEELAPSRSAVGVTSLPGGASVEIETIVKLHP